MNDEEIIKLFEARDEKGISAAGERYGKLLRSVARGILRSEQDAEECESEALLRAWNSIPPARPERHIHFVLLRSRVADILAKLKELSLHRA